MFVMRKLKANGCFKSQIQKGGDRQLFVQNGAASKLSWHVSYALEEWLHLSFIIGVGARAKSRVVFSPRFGAQAYDVC